MKFVFALAPAAIVVGALMNLPAEAGCGNHGGCNARHAEAKAKGAKTGSGPAKAAHGRNAKAAHSRNAKAAHGRSAKAAHLRAAKTVAARISKLEHSRPAKPNLASEVRIADTGTKAGDLPGVERHPADTLQGLAELHALDDFATRHVALAASISGFESPGADTSHMVIDMIESMSPGYEVPTWFALRIAKIESNYNPQVRGRDGEYGIFQIKCDTARMLGFSGDCANLADARTNIEWGLKHLSEALKSSKGNLELAASKHNAGLGRRTLVREYVRMVF